MASVTGGGGVEMFLHDVGNNKGSVTKSSNEGELNARDLFTEELRFPQNANSAAASSRHLAFSCLVTAAAFFSLLFTPPSQTVLDVSRRMFKKMHACHISCLVHSEEA